MKLKSFLLKLKQIIFKKKNLKWVVLLLVIIILISFNMFRKKVNEFTIEDHELYQYTTGIRIEYKGKIKLDKDNNITTITFGKDTVNLTTTPLYYKGENKVLFPKSMAVIYPAAGTQFKINYYSTVYQDLDEYVVEDGNLKKVLKNYLIYDGNNLYFFPNNVIVNVDDKTIELAPLSYIVVDTLDNKLEVYDRSKDDYEIYDIVGDVKISIGNSTVNASKDLMYYQDKSKLFIKSIEDLKQLS